ncbi:phosphohydrolase [Billgrantia montanilacus]|uniref:Phosphohydrolase n=2 Tax=Billgrantia montanilacus TaxID=2282305 RepID=A0A368TQR4_9GAMM|nr:phosphohydrolase [Halomonas montanilacus]
MPAILTASGMTLPLTYPSWRLIDDRDIAQALSRICRFGGHSRQFYSVAQHCVLASHLVPPEDALAALLHDAPEAYIGDMISPLKAMLPAYQAVEQRIWSAIAQRFDVDPVMPASVKQVDLQLLATERRDLLPYSPQEWTCLEGVSPLSAQIEPWSPDMASLAWGLRLQELLAEREGV